MSANLSSKVIDFFKGDASRHEGVSGFRVFLMRLLYVLTFISLGREAWFEIFTHKETWNPMIGVTFSFWAAYATLMLIGLRFPLKMVP